MYVGATLVVALSQSGSQYARLQAIIGGDHKGRPYRPWTPVVAGGRKRDSGRSKSALIEKIAG